MTDAIEFHRDDDGQLVGVGDIELATGPITDVADLAGFIPIYCRSDEDAADVQRLVAALQRRWIAFAQELRAGMGAEYLHGLAQKGNPPMRVIVERDESGKPIGAVHVPISVEEARRLERQARE